MKTGLIVLSHLIFCTIQMFAQNNMYLLNIAYPGESGSFAHIENDVVATEILIKHSLHNSSLEYNQSKYFKPHETGILKFLNHELDSLNGIVKDSSTVYLIFHGHGGGDGKGKFAFYLDGKDVITFENTVDSLLTIFKTKKNVTAVPLFNCCDFKFKLSRFFSFLYGITSYFLPMDYEISFSEVVKEIMNSEAKDISIEQKTNIISIIRRKALQSMLYLNGMSSRNANLSLDSTNPANLFVRSPKLIDTSNKLILLGFAGTPNPNGKEKTSYLGSHFLALDTLNMNFNIDKLYLVSKEILNIGPLLNRTSNRYAYNLQMQIYFDSNTSDNEIKRYYSEEIIPFATY